MDEGLLAQVNEVVWECGLGPDCNMCGALFLPRGWICSPIRPLVRLSSPPAVYALTHLGVCTDACVLGHQGRSVCVPDVAFRMTLVEAFLSLLLVLEFVH